MKKIFIACHANIARGGPELLHQLCFKLRMLGYDATMYYSDFEIKNGIPIHENYLHYKNPYIIKYIDDENNILIASETNSKVFCYASKSSKIFWWLSVDYFREGIIGGLNRFPFSKFLFHEIYLFKRLLKKAYNIRKENITHFVQSRYAFEYCKDIGINLNKIYYLSDYLNDEFMKCKLDTPYARENIVLYNHTKGYKFTKILIEKSPDIHWIPLVDLSYKKLVELMRKAKVYVDFGNHPGKDRMPREAALNGCCVITGKRGAAFFQEDVNIPVEFKFEDKRENAEAVIKKIRDIFLRYKEYNSCFDVYRKSILGEEKAFEERIKIIFSRLI